MDIDQIPGMCEKVMRQSTKTVVLVPHRMNVKPEYLRGLAIYEHSKICWLVFSDLHIQTNPATLWSKNLPVGYDDWTRKCKMYKSGESHSLPSPPGSSVHGILQARILEWVTVPFSRGSSQPRSPALQANSLPAELGKLQLEKKDYPQIRSRQLFAAKRYKKKLISKPSGNLV